MPYSRTAIERSAFSVGAFEYVMMINPSVSSNFARAASPESQHPSMNWASAVTGMGPARLRGGTAVRLRRTVRWDGRTVARRRSGVGVRTAAQTG